MSASIATKRIEFEGLRSIKPSKRQRVCSAELKDDKKCEMDQLSARLAQVTTELEELKNSSRKDKKKIIELQKKVDTLEKKLEELKLRIPKQLALGEVLKIFQINAPVFVHKVGGPAFLFMLRNAPTLPDQHSDKIRWKQITEGLGITWGASYKELIDEACPKRNLEAHQFNPENAMLEIMENYEHYEQEAKDILKIVITLNNIMVVGEYAKQFEGKIHRFSKSKSKSKSEKFPWEARHETALKEMKKLARDDKVVLQHIDITKAKEDIKRVVPPEYEAECMQILDMMVRIREFDPNFTEWKLPKRKTQL